MSEHGESNCSWIHLTQSRVRQLYLFLIRFPVFQILPFPAITSRTSIPVYGVIIYTSYSRDTDGTTPQVRFTPSVLTVPGSYIFPLPLSRYLPSLGRRIRRSTHLMLLIHSKRISHFDSRIQQ